MSAAVAELDAALQAMLALKPPGVSGSRIGNITALCTQNVQSESILIQKLYTHFKKAPGTHKLGVLYVVDSVTRKWAEQARLAGQPIGSSAQDGTFAAGVNRVKELLPGLMNDIIQSAPEDQKDKIRKLLDIWDKGQTFPPQMLNSFKEKLNAPLQKSTTPPGSPPAGLSASLGYPQPTSGPAASAAAPTPSNTSSILAALANIARQNTNAAPVAPAPMPPAPTPHGLMGVPLAPPVSLPAVPSYPPPTQLLPTGFPIMPASNPAVSVPAVPAPVPAQGVDTALQQKIQILQVLAAQGVPQDQWPKILEALTPGGQSLPGAPSAGGVPPTAAAQPPSAWGPKPDDSRDRNGFPDGTRSPPYRRRSRSRSPNRSWAGRDTPNRRHDHERDSPNRGRGRGRDARDEYRQRSPPGRRARTPSPQRRSGPPKYVEYDPSIGQGKIKVMSRTLFVGGVTQPEADLRQIFERFGAVQTCIVNREKRHAFVKMFAREDAVRAKSEMENPDTGHPHLRTRWGVGFGPRDCSDYQTGISIIPIHRLTDADKKWMLTAEFGGSGGKPIESGLVVEEPDIEIGQGVSSKAISRRMQTDKSGSHGPRSGRERERETERERERERDRERDDRGPPRRDRPDRRHDASHDRNASTASNPIMPPSLGGFTLPIPLQGGMPAMFPGMMAGSANASSSSGQP